MKKIMRFFGLPGPRFVMAPIRASVKPAAPSAAEMRVHNYNRMALAAMARERHAVDMR